ncbi:hypothetical protein [Micromonospora musae]|uniref:hypothetical protein n=1 Tax=Micromonospora musae TaxID=1894970 RepID=UPI0033F7C94C
MTRAARPPRRPWLLLGLLLGLAPVLTPVAAQATAPRAAQPPSAVPGTAPAGPVDLTAARSGPPVRAGAPTATAGTPASPSTTRYYVVGPPRDGQREYLYQIAVQTLGDGNRYREIFALNRDRPQPDGGTLTEPLTALQPGWILELPPDAKGSAVRVGPLPAPSEARASGSAAEKDGAGATPYLVGAAGLVVMAVLLAVVLRLVRGGARPRPAAPETVEPAEPGTTEPAEPGIAEASEPKTVEPAEPGVAGPAATGDPAAAARPTESVEPEAEAEADGASGAVEPDDAEPAPAPPVEVATTTVVVVRPVSLLTTSGRVTVQLESLTADPDRLDVRLLGTAGDGSAQTPCAWIGDGPLPDATMPVVLGRDGERRLFVDLAAAPDVLTVTGATPAARRQALAFAAQLDTAGATVFVVGDALGPDAPAQYRRLATFADPAGIGATATGPAVIFSGGLRGAELTAARGLAARTGHRMLPVLVGEVVRSRWSVRVAGSAR